MSTAKGEKGLELELLKKPKLILNKEGRICAQMEQYVVRNKNDSNPFKISNHSNDPNYSALRLFTHYIFLSLIMTIFPLMINSSD